MQYYLITLSEEADDLCDGLFILAVDSLSDASFNRICGVLEKAIKRSDRRKSKAGLIF